MSRVDTKCTYTQQVLLAYLADCARSNDDEAAEMLLKVRTSQEPYEIKYDAQWYYAGLASHSNPIDDYEAAKAKQGSIDVVKDQLMFAGLMDRNCRQQRALSAIQRTRAMKEILKKHKIDTVYTDFEATCYCMEQMITDNDWFDPPNIKKCRKVTKIVNDTMSVLAAYHKLSWPFLADRLQKMTINPMMDKKTRNAYTNATATESLLLSCVSSSSREVEDMQKGPMYAQVHQDASEWYKVNTGKIMSSIRESPCSFYRMANLWLIIRKGTMYMMDRSGIDEMRNRIWSVFMFRWYALNYRLCGTEGKEMDNFEEQYYIAENWLMGKVRKAKSGMFHPARIARSMKTGYARMVNDGWASGEKSDFGAASRSKELLASEKEEMPVLDVWSEFLKNSKMTDNARADIGYLFHLMPCPDINIQELFIDVCERLGNERAPDPAAEAEFLRYVQASSVSRYVTTEKEKGSHTSAIKRCIECDDGYDLSREEWFNSCYAGVPMMPPIEDWGKARLRGAFPLIPKSLFWHLDAKDATHVMANQDEIFATDIDNYTKRIESNEITYVLKYGSKMSRVYKPEDVRNAMANGRAKGDVVATLAAKAENTKYGRKARETYSGADTQREMISELDHSAQSYSSMMVGPSLRQSEYKLQAETREIMKGQTTPKRASSLSVLTSQDVASWSPAMNRRFAMAFYNEVIRMTTAPKTLKIDPYYRSIKVANCRRGVRAIEETTTGNFMGFPGTFDTCLHANIIGYMTNVAKRKGIIGTSDVCELMVTIDDGLCRIIFHRPPTMTDEEAYNRVNNMMEHMVEVYGSLGFVIDPVKTIVSTVKCTYLNRLYACGTEVLTPMKVFGKVNRELSKRFSSTNAQMQSILTSMSGAAFRGADPLFCYLAAMWLSVNLMSMTCQKFTRMYPFLTAFVVVTPSELGGMGFPTIYAWMTKESVDKLSEFFSIMHNLGRVIDSGDPDERTIKFNRGMLTRYLSMVYHLECKKLTPYEVVLNARSYIPKGLPNPESVTRDVFRAAAQALADCKESKAMLRVADDQAMKAYIDKTFSGSTMDAGILDIIGSSLPSTAMTAFIDKAERNETIAMLLTRKEIEQLSRRVKRTDQKRASYLFARYEEEQDVYPFDFVQPGHVVADAMRKRIHATANMKVTNATLGCAMDVLQHIDVSADEKATRYCYIECNKIMKMFNMQPRTANMYDGRMEKGNKQSFVTSGGVSFNSAYSKSGDIVSKNLIMMAYACASLYHRNVDPSFLWEAVKKSWVGDMPIEWQSISEKMDPSISTKRISPVTNNVSHPIAGFPNVTSCISVNVQPLATLLDAGRYMGDLVSVIVCMRTQGLMERAIRNGIFGKMSYGIDLHGLVPFDNSPIGFADDISGIDGIDAIVPLTERMENASIYTQALIASHNEYIEKVDDGDSDEKAMIIACGAPTAITAKDRSAIARMGEKYTITNLIVNAITDRNPIESRASISGIHRHANMDLAAAPSRATLKAEIDKYGKDGTDVLNAMKIACSTMVNVITKNCFTNFNSEKIVFSETQARANLEAITTSSKIIHCFGIAVNTYRHCKTKDKSKVMQLLYGASVQSALHAADATKMAYIVNAMLTKHKGSGTGADDFVVASREGKLSTVLRKSIEREVGTMIDKPKNTIDWWRSHMKTSVLSAVLTVDPDTADGKTVAMAASTQMIAVCDQFVRHKSKGVKQVSFRGIHGVSELDHELFRRLREKIVEQRPVCKELKNKMKVLFNWIAGNHEVRSTVDDVILSYRVELFESNRIEYMKRSQVKDATPAIKESRKPAAPTGRADESNVNIFDELFGAGVSGIDDPNLLDPAGAEASTSADTLTDESTPAEERIQAVKELERVHGVRATGLAMMHLDSTILPDMQKTLTTFESRVLWGMSNYPKCEEIAKANASKFANNVEFEYVKSQYEIALREKGNRSNADTTGPPKK